MERLYDLVTGNLSTQERIWSALAPGMMLTAYFLLALVAYAIRCGVRGPYADPELAARETTVITGRWVRFFFAWAMRPLWAVVRRSGIPASAVTTLSLLLSFAAGVSIAVGRFGLGGWLFLFAGICDFLDGRLARARSEASARGGLLDSVLDRYSEAAVFIGLAWFYRGSWVLLAVLAALAGSQLTSYVRAKGESLGIKITVGFVQRAERILLLGTAVALSPVVEAFLAPRDPRPSHRLAIFAIVVLAIATQVTAMRRLVYGLGALGAKPLRGWFSASRGSLVRNVAAAILATAADFAVFTALVALSGLAPWSATACGCAVGAVVNFNVNRFWVFRSKTPPLQQSLRYAFVSVTSAFLNSGGVAILMLVPSARSWIAWSLARVAVFLAWNFPLHRDYVFKSDIPGGSGEAVDGGSGR
jgi:phosphatidylglycerophosphate synthase/putative flippase GtrA